MSRTAGNWVAHPYDGRFGSVITTDDGKAIAFVLSQPDPLEGEDNARLISCAPALYGGLVMAVERHPEDSDLAEIVTKAGPL